MSLLSHFMQTAQGAYLLQDWLGEGGEPVSHELAAARAKICETCPENSHPLWWEHTKDIIADIIKKQLELKHVMQLRVPNEDFLHMCRQCGCCVRLKVHTPMEYIRKHTLKRQLEAFPEHCWQRNEP